MSVKIRLTRTGGKNEPSYRLVAADSRSPRGGSFLEVLGWYDPKRSGANFKLDCQRVEFWKSRGAILSETAKSLIKRARKAGQMAEPAAAPAPTPAAAPSPTAAPAAGTDEQTTAG